MTDFRKVTDDLSVSPQISVEDLAAAKAAGFRTIICNRPDNEEGPDQPGIAEMTDQANALGLTFLALPFSGGPSPEIAAQQGALIAAAEKPVLAYCRSGTRSITAWALSEAGKGRGPAIIKAANAAGYDLSSLAEHL